MYLTLAFAWVSVWRFQDLVPIIGKLKLAMVLEFVLAHCVPRTNVKRTRT